MLKSAEKVPFFSGTPYESAHFKDENLFFKVLYAASEYASVHIASILPCQTRIIQTVVKTSYF